MKITIEIDDSVDPDTLVLFMAKAREAVIASSTNMHEARVAKWDMLKDIGASEDPLINEAITKRIEELEKEIGLIKLTRIVTLSALSNIAREAEWSKYK